MNETLSNFTNISDFLQNILRYSFTPYLDILSNLAWGIIFGFIGAAIYVNSRNLPALFGYLVFIGIFFSIVLPTAVFAIFGLITGLIGTYFIYRLLTK